MQYSYAQLSRNDFGVARLPISGIGLGNLLFPWARFMIATKKRGLRPIFPTWFQIRFGPLLRGEKDPRFYQNLFRRPKGQIGGIKKLYLLSRGRRISEDDFCSSSQRMHQPPLVVVFEGERDRFKPLNGWHQFLLEALREMTKEKWLKKTEEIGKIPIGIHVRRGDFSLPESEKDFQTKGSLQTPLSWFIASLNWVRKELGFAVKAFVFSDGDERELKDLLTLQNVILVKTGSVISDLLALSRVGLLIASGGSSLSAWASFLGQMPTLSHPGQSLAWFNLVNSKGHYTCDFDSNFPPPSLLLKQRKALLGDAGRC